MRCVVDSPWSRPNRSRAPTGYCGRRTGIGEHTRVVWNASDHDRDSRLSIGGSSDCRGRPADLAGPTAPADNAYPVRATGGP